MQGSSSTTNVRECDDDDDWIALVTHFRLFHYFVFRRHLSSSYNGPRVAPGRLMMVPRFCCDFVWCSMICSIVLFSSSPPPAPRDPLSLSSRGMRWRLLMLAVEGLLVDATGWAYQPPPIVRAWSQPKRPSNSRHQHQEQRLPQQRVEFKAIRRRRVLPTAMTATAGGGGGCGSGDGPSKKYNKDAWQRRASRAMKYVSMPIVKKAGQPREQVCASDG